MPTYTSYSIVDDFGGTIPDGSSLRSDIKNADPDPLPTAVFKSVSVGAIWDAEDGKLKSDSDAVTIETENAVPAGEKTALDAVIANYGQTIEPTGDGVYVETPYKRGLPLKKEWFATDNGNNTFSGLSESIEYTYKGLNLLSETHKRYSNTGAVISEVVYDWFMLKDKRRVRKKR